MDLPGNRRRRCSDVLDTTINYGAHEKFVTKWLDKIDAEEKQSTQADEAAPTPAPAAGGQPSEAESEAQNTDKEAAQA